MLGRNFRDPVEGPVSQVGLMQRGERCKAFCLLIDCLCDLLIAETEYAGELFRGKVHVLFAVHGFQIDAMTAFEQEASFMPEGRHQMLSVLRALRRGR